ncbi:hypothetical protein GKZ68_01485 [Hymenobacter sp. BRD128]|uniref:hypothetical protein n=1 Tax=Hymenobacter sp. BRD128 TaxID=2675878 RepID=UPI0015678687|nr:hypothetical protein [Hymenobacter sp. BRD128]QKG55426.1 hypothetical protein GKZ68_01485 [Hymenobacter sp. BRD128]
MVTLVLVTACKKEVEKIVVQEVDKQYSWSEVKQLYGLQKFIIGMSKDANSIYLQQPSWFGVLTPSPTATARRTYGYYESVTGPLSTVVLPADVQTRIPLGPNFFAYPYHSDSVLLAFPTAPPFAANLGAEIHLHRLDPTATVFVNNRGYVPLQFGAINNNNQLLVNYLTTKYPDPNLHFTLSKITTYFGQVTAQTQVVQVPLSATGTYAGFCTVAVIDEYFLVNAFNQGIYKIKPDGTARQVFGPAAVVNYYKWQGTVYAVEGNGSRAVITSADNGETWQRFTGVPNYFGVSTFRPVGDSLVGITHTIITNSLYSLRWQGNSYRVRELKNDGLGQADFTDLAQLGDTVYLGTTNGLFKRPLSNFFESKPK